MRYYLDFDRVVFDTDAFVTYLKGKPGWETLIPESATDLNAYLADAVYKGSLALEPGELSRFVFPDAATFLREKENAVTIITSGDRTLQEMKTKSALYGIPRMAVMYTENVHKGDYLAPHTHLHSDAVLADDSPAELEILAARCPLLTLYEVRRDGMPGDGRWTVIRSLSELS